MAGVGGDADDFGDLAGVVIHEGDVGGFDRGGGAGGAHRDADVGAGEGGGVVDAVADHCDGSVVGDEVGDRGEFVVGE